MDRYAPPGVLLDSRFSVVQFRGHTGPYLEPAPGEATLDVLRMARPGLSLQLRAALHQARRTGAAVRVDGIALPPAGLPRALATGEAAGAASASRSSPSPPAPASPTPAQIPGSWCSSRSRTPPAARPRFVRAAPAGPAGPATADDAQVAALERELTETREHLQVTVEEQEATYEELHAVNEELSASNEELQAINEELETSKEEQGVACEELATLNQELRLRNHALDQANDDLGNLLGGVDVPLLMLGPDLCLRRFTPSAERALRLARRDIGRPLGDLGLHLAGPELERLVAEVIATEQTLELEVQRREGSWYAMRIRPCRTADHRIAGAVVALLDIERPGRERASEPAARGAE